MKVRPWMIWIWLAVTFVIMGAAAGAIGLFFYWSNEPANLPVVKQPVPIMNLDHEVAVGEAIVLKVVVVKTVDVEVSHSTRTLECGKQDPDKRTNLVTLTSTVTQLPLTGPGGKTLISNNIILPPKVTPGEVCTVHWDVEYHINPLRDEFPRGDETLEMVSEDFTVVEREESDESQ